ncbi:helix-turn-helix domain-containing protein [Paenibacillus hamazuiensis]|uniref:helix-turn-helix domain-containing protein n=1 Tax=Paenibacillus hamazuiensis TaxID=2936508 RepID=UPI0020106391|nr:helix-turn-helix transcriptional regulator [Paenibacillus hamazuiensis]
MELVEKIKEVMKSKGLTQYKLAKNSKIPHSTMSTLLNGGIKSPTIELIAKIADTLEVPVSVLLGEDELGELLTREKEELELNQKIYVLLNLVSNNGKVFPAEAHQEIFNIFGGSLFAKVPEVNLFDEWYRKYLEEGDSLYTSNEAEEKFNKFYNPATIMHRLREWKDVDFRIKERYLSKLKQLKVSLTTPSWISENDKVFQIEDLTSYQISYKGKELTSDQKQKLLKLTQALLD